MRFLIVSSLIAISAIAPAASAMTYEEAKASGVSPVTGSEMVMCAVYWSAWNESLNPDYYGEGSGIWSSSFVEKLNPEIQRAAALETADYWFGRAKADFEAHDDLDAFHQQIYDAPTYDVEALDERKFMQLLGECARPD